MPGTGQIAALLRHISLIATYYRSTSEVRLATQTSPLMSIVPIFWGDITYNPL